MHSRLVQIQLEVRLAGTGVPVLGAREALVVPCAPTGAAQISVVQRRCRCSSGSRREWENFGRDVCDTGGVEWLRREQRLVVLGRRVEYGAQWSRHCGSANRQK